MLLFVTEKDGDIDLAPLVAMVPADLRKYTGSLKQLSQYIFYFRYFFNIFNVSFFIIYLYQFFVIFFIIFIGYLLTQFFLI